MLILATDTSTRSGSVALLSNRQVLVGVDDSGEVPYAARLFHDVARVQASAKVSLKDVDLFAVAAGPGSFAGLRVGLSAVKAWAEVYEKPIAAVSGLEAIAVQACAEGDFVAPCMDARRGAVFGAVYRREPSNPMRLELVGSESILSLEEFAAVVAGTCGSAPVVIASPTPDAIALQSVFAGNAAIQIEAVSPVLAPVIGRIGFERATRGEVVNALHLDANYIRRSDAEVKKGS